ncbi:hypothetical protein [Halobacillus halophilus]|uniref:hypothetical protein n=1 Tax=Halobacillus halophilus TaxID=1570 RepID=UPI001CD7E94D|nr:hypothetical protein [Halobacillus halophilus]MCA1011125.1 hypothetical protein [Halobacillus halophilus]
MNKIEQEWLVTQVVTEIYHDYPYLWEKFGQHGRDRTEEDNYHHLDHLKTAYEMGDGAFFIDYTEWLNSVLTARDVGTSLIIDNYERLIRLLKHSDFAASYEKNVYIEFLQQALDYLRTRSE